MMHFRHEYKVLGPDWFALRMAASWICAGGIVAHATEGVWGLACNPFDAGAVDYLLGIKKRSHKQGLILIGANAETFKRQLESLDVDVQSHIRASWPGASTWILPDKTYPNWIRGGRDSVAVRVPGNKQARQLCSIVGHPVVSTSANISGRPPALTQMQARSAFGGTVDYYLCGPVVMLENEGALSQKGVLSDKQIPGESNGHNDLGMPGQRSKAHGNIVCSPLSGKVSTITDALSMTIARVGSGD